MECTPGEQKCIGFHSYICNTFGEWVILEYNAPECQIPPPPPECTEGAQKCIGFNSYICSGGKWVILEYNAPQCGYEPPPETFHLSIYVPSWAAGGYVEPGSGDYPAYSTVKLTAHPLTGYQFTAWGRDASGTSLTYNLYMNSDKNVEAYFKKVPVPEFKGSIAKKELEYNGDRKPIPVH